MGLQNSQSKDGGRAKRGPDKGFDPKVALEAAMTLFWKQGYAATGIQQLLDVMDIGRQSLYDTFGNKRALFTKALEHYAETQLAKMEVQLLVDDGGSPLQTLRDFFSEMDKNQKKSRSLGCMIGNTMAQCTHEDKDLLRFITQMREQSAKLYQRVIIQAQEAGEIQSKLDAEEIARLLVTISYGSALIHRAQDKSKRRYQPFGTVFDSIATER